MAATYDWAATHRPAGTGSVRHRLGTSSAVQLGPVSRAEREAAEDARLAPGATRACGAGVRLIPEEPDPWRTCFERDRDRILHSKAFRRLAGKTQVHIHPEDHQRTRLTHALEVAQVAVGIARPLGLNETLTEAIALGHDCGHGPGGHASEDAFSPYIDGGFHHAPWGADVTLEPLNLTFEVADGIRNHSWSRPAPASPEALVVSWADRIAYVAHDLEDAIEAGIISAEHLPDVLPASGKRDLLAFLIDGMIAGSLESGTIGMRDDAAEILAAMRAWNYEFIYTRPASTAQGERVVALLRALVEFHTDRPGLIPDAPTGLRSGSDDAAWWAVRWIAGMTDRFAYRQAVALLGWNEQLLPAGVG